MRTDLRAAAMGQGASWVPTAPVAALVVLAAAGCTYPQPAGPTFVALPGSGKSFAQFAMDDARCRQTATAAIGHTSPQQAAAQSGVASAAVGTGVGAAAGALLGAAAGNAGAGAAIGAGTGLLAGSAIGAGAAQTSASNLQRTYDVAYTQCMTAAGNQVPNMNAPAVVYAPPIYGPPVYVAPYAGYYGYSWGRSWWGW